MSDLLGTAAGYVEQGGSMQEAEFYDLAMTGDGEPAMLPVYESPWLPIYSEAARWIPSSAPVVDLGCGTGRFLALLAQTSHHATMRGVDFSPAAVAEARNYLRSVFDDELDFYHRVTVDVADLREWKPDPQAAPNTTYTCLEVLEHIENDLGVVSAVPAGAQFIFSVPSYLSASHVRAFTSLREVFERFGHLVRIVRWTLVDFGGGNVVHVVDSRRRVDAW